MYLILLFLLFYFSKKNKKYYSSNNFEIFMTSVRKIFQFIFYQERKILLF